MSSFRSTPPVTQTGLPLAVSTALASMSENVALLTGERGDKSLKAVTKGQITVASIALSLKALNSNASYVSVLDSTGAATVKVIPVAAYVALQNDVEKLRQDLANVTAAFNTLITQLKA